MQAARFALKELGLPLPPDNHVLRLVGLPEAEYYAAMVPPEHVGRASRLINEKEVELLRKEGRLYPKAHETLKALKGRRLGLVTNAGRDYCRAAVERTVLYQHFELILCSSDAPDQGKKELVRRALEQLGGPAALVGDRQSDREAAQANGIPFIACTWGFGGPEELRIADARVDSFTELLAILTPCAGSSSSSSP